ncbi:MAG TPA: type II toxin-antitoxin system death-on-curing family toxin [Patescibacteria group bacterium]|nr:type II toxin-antitoxin system death-on-curing family toxin [Patescibacteria group bacterium]
MKYLTIEEVLFIHDRAIKRFGGSSGIRDIGLLHSALGRPQASFDGQDLYKTIFEKAAALIHSLLKNHPFIDGNKRTSYATTGLFLEINGYMLSNEHKNAIQFTMHVENNQLSLEDIASWLENHTKSHK